jgi:hypothetical protein
MLVQRLSKVVRKVQTESETRDIPSEKGGLKSIDALGRKREPISKPLSE